MNERKKTTQRIPFSEIRKEIVQDKCKGICLHCGKKITIHNDFSIEHVIPLKKGGSNDLVNLVALCQTCNKDKSDDIVDPSYYKHATKLVKAEIDALFNSYFTEHDWLVDSNLFKLDYFMIPVTKVIVYAKGTKLKKAEDECAVRVVRDDGELERIKTTYVENFTSREDRLYILDNLSFSDLDKKRRAHWRKLYKIVFHDKLLCYFDTKIAKGRTEYDLGANTVRLRLYINPNVIWTTMLSDIVAQCVTKLMGEFESSMNEKSTRGIIYWYTDILSQDKRGLSVVKILSDMFDNPLIEYTHAEGAELIRSVVIVTCGVYNDLKEDERPDRDNPEEFKRIEKKYRHELWDRIRGK